MNKYEIIKTEDTPLIILDPENEIFEISGMSLPENVNILFTPVIEWFKNYFLDPLHETVISINLEYFNSASSKKIVELFMLFEEFSEINCKIKILWYYKKNDFTMQRKGSDLLKLFKIESEVISL